MSAPLVIGLDPSLVATGIAGLGWAEVLRPKRRTGHERLAWLRSEVADRVKRADLVVIEGPSHGSALQGGHHELAGLWWLLAQDLWAAGIPYAVCPPHNRTIYATGEAFPARSYPKTMRSRVAKAMVRTAAAERYGVELEGVGKFDKADALVMAMAGLDYIGFSVPAVPKTHRRALGGISWPEPAVLDLLHAACAQVD
ncbi:hypothetical protein [Streptomyces sp. NPDC093261]|uniref:hypothetical protein n=1 Tax=Streptomyces sp. NPDC093261 TaxID=3366037 RepID=UPI003830B7EE